MGDELATTSSYWLVTEPLAAAMREAGLMGVEWADVVVTRGDQYDVVPHRYDLPASWVRVVPAGTRAAGDDVVLEDRAQLLLSEAALFLWRR